MTRDKAGEENGAAPLPDVVLSLYQAIDHPTLWARWIEEHGDRAKESATLGRHLHLAQRLRRRLRAAGAERHVTTTLLERLPIAAVLVDIEGAPVAFNSTARALAAGTAGISLGQNSFGAPSPELTKLLVRTVQRVASGGPDGTPHATEATLTLPRAAGPQPLQVRVVGVTAEDANGDHDPRVAAIVLIGDPECAVEINPERLAKLFHLTAAETRIGVGLANGLSVAKLAETLSVSRNTVRWHLKHVLQKAGVKTQAQFVRLVHRSPAGLS